MKSAMGSMSSRRFREIYPEQRVIIAGGHAPTERIERVLAAGLTYLAKPFTADQIELAVKKALAHPAVPIRCSRRP